MILLTANGHSVNVPLYFLQESNHDMHLVQPSTVINPTLKLIELEAEEARYLAAADRETHVPNGTHDDNDAWHITQLQSDARIHLLHFLLVPFLLQAFPLMLDGLFEYHVFPNNSLGNWFSKMDLEIFKTLCMPLMRMPIPSLEDSGGIVF